MKILAMYIGCSPSHFSRKIKLHTYVFLSKHQNDTKKQTKLIIYIQTTHLTKNWKHVPGTTHCYKSINNRISNLQTSIRDTCKLWNCCWQLKREHVNNCLPHHQTIYEVVSKSKHLSTINKTKGNKTWSSEGEHKYP